MRLKELRVNKKLTQEEVSKVLGISRTNYNRYETGKVKPDFNSLILLADFYGVSIDYIVQRKSEVCIYPKLLSENKQKALDFVLKADDTQCKQFISFFSGMEFGKENQLNEIINLFF